MIGVCAVAACAVTAGLLKSTSRILNLLKADKTDSDVGSDIAASAVFRARPVTVFKCYTAKRICTLTRLLRRLYHAARFKVGRFSACLVDRGFCYSTHGVPLDFSRRGKPTDNVDVWLCSTRASRP